MHGGYFADAAVVAPLVAAISRAAAQHPPAVLADLGGGTGFLLERLAAQGSLDGTAMVNVDLSPRQLEQSRDRRIVQLNRSAAGVTREELYGVRDSEVTEVTHPGGLMLVMRSLLHYFGRDGLEPFLAHLRSQMRSGEVLVQQTACFTEARDAGCLNDLYRLMRTEKWYPTLEELQAALQQCGWSMIDIQPAPPLPLTSADLARRYQLSAADVEMIGRELSGKFGRIVGVFEPAPQGFTAYLHYQIMTCTAAPRAGA